MKKLLTYSAVLASTVYLVGCGGGNNSNNTPPADTKTTFRIDNQTSDNFSSVVVKNSDTGAELYSGDLNCASKDKRCALYYTGANLNSAVTLLFKDSSNKIVAAYLVPSIPGENYLVEVDERDTGLYLFKMLKKSNAEIANLEQSEIEARLFNFMQNYTSPDGAVDFYEEIAAYYAQKNQNANFKESEFLSDFATRLLNSETAEAYEFKPIVVAAAPRLSLYSFFIKHGFDNWSFINNANAVEVTCPAGVSTFLSFIGTAMGGVQNAFPLAGTVGVAVNQVGTEICNTGEVSLADLSKKLDAIQTSVDALADKVGKLQDLALTFEVNSILDRFSTTSNVMKDRGANFEALSPNGSSLLSYVEKNKTPAKNSTVVSGSDDLAYATENSTALKEVLLSVTGLGKADGSIITQVENLTLNKFSSLTLALKEKCQDSTEGDIVSRRVQCNLAIATSMGRLAANQEVVLRIAKDAYEVMANYPVTAVKTYGFKADPENRTAKAYSDALYATLKQKFENQFKTAKESFEAIATNGGAPTDQIKKGYFDAYYGLPEVLVTNTTTVCSNNLKKPAIIGWNKEQAGKNEWIETECSTSNTSYIPVKARYWLKINNASVNGNYVANVMGVLVQDMYVSGSEFWYEGSRYGSGRAYSDFLLAMALTNEAPKANTFAFNNQNGRGVNKMIVPNRKVNPNATRQLKRVKSPAPGFSSEVTLLNTDYYGTPSNSGGPKSDGYVYNWMRYTDTAGYSYVFYLANSGYWYLMCLTGDCNIQNQINLGFEKGPQNLGFIDTLNFDYIPPNGYRPVTDQAQIKTWKTGSDVPLFK